MYVGGTIGKEIRCNRCGSTDIIKAGRHYRQGVKNVQRYRCKACGKLFLEDGIQEAK